MKPSSPSYQNQTKTPPKKENYRPVSSVNMDAKGLTKYQQTKANNTEGSYTTAKVDSSQSHKDGSTYANQPT